jgi:ribose-phosphate pyrophosphokinase
MARIESCPLSRLIVTDSINLSEEKRSSPKLVVLSVAELLGKAIRNIHEEASVTSLFV